MDLKTEIINDCELCGHTGVLDGSVCECICKFRAFNHMMDEGFNINTLKLVSKGYTIPEIISGDSYIEFYNNNHEAVDNSGLSIYIFSREKGWGKTTLAHWLVYEKSKHFMITKNYNRDRTFHFDRSNDLIRSGYEEGLWKNKYYVLDDLGTEDRSSEWNRSLFLTRLQDIMHYRRNGLLPTIITTNYTPSDLSSLYGGVMDSVLEIGPDGNIGGSLFRQIEVGGGVDFRLSMNNGGWPSDNKS